MSESVSTRQEEHIRRALSLAEAAVSNGNHPFGAILVDNRSNTVMCEAENTVTTQHDPSRHAELNLVQKAWATLSAEQIKYCTLYTSTEPCPMCSGAIYWSGIRSVVYSFPAADLGALAGDSFCVPCSQIFDAACAVDPGNPSLRTEVIGPVLPELGRAAHGKFWDFLKEKES